MEEPCLLTTCVARVGACPPERRGQNAGVSTLRFELAYQSQSAGPCKSMSVEYIQLFFEDNLQDAISGITLAGLSVKWTLGYVAALPYANVSPRALTG